MPPSLESIFGIVADSGQSAVIRGLLREGFDFINHASNTFVNCMTRPGSDDVVLINIETDCAPAFYRYCQANPDNPFLPKIHEMKNFGWGAAVRMERLIALDHIDINPLDTAHLSIEAPAMVRFIRGESSEAELAETKAKDPVKYQTVRDLLKISQFVYYATEGQTLPFCDLKLDNIFLRKTENERQLVFGDPLFPGSGRNAVNMTFMQNAYKRFDLPPLNAAIPMAHLAQTL